MRIEPGGRAAGDDRPGGAAPLERYLAHLDSRGLAGSYRRRKVAAIRTFFGFLHQQGLLPRSPAEELLPPARERYQPRVLTQAEYKRLLDAVRHEPRDGAIIELLQPTGLRVSELAWLRLSDVLRPAYGWGLKLQSPREGVLVAVVAWAKTGRFVAIRRRS